MDTIWLEAECSRYEFFADVVAQTHPDIGIVALSSNPEKALQLVTQLHETSPECSIIVISSSTDGNLILRAMRAASRSSCLSRCALRTWWRPLNVSASQRFGRGDTKARSSTVIAVAGATGGVGATSLAVNLGCILAANQENSVALVDIDLCLGDADVFLDTIPDYTLVDVAQNVTRLDFTLLKRSLTKHASGLYLLPRPIQLEDASLITPDDLRRVVGLLKATFSHVIIDLSKSYNPIDIVALEMANHILLITQLDLPCLRNVVRLLMSFGQMDAIKDKVKIIVNRAGMDNNIGIKKAEETIGREVFWQLPNDYRVMVEVAQQRRAADRASPQGGDHAVDHRPGRSPVRHGRTGGRGGAAGFESRRDEQIA